VALPFRANASCQTSSFVTARHISHCRLSKGCDYAALFTKSLEAEQELLQISSDLAVSPLTAVAVTTAKP
jgi:hypothetical protein